MTGRGKDKQRRGPGGPFDWEGLRSPPPRTVNTPAAIALQAVLNPSYLQDLVYTVDHLTHAEVVFGRRWDVLSEFLDLPPMLPGVFVPDVREDLVVVVQLGDAEGSNLTILMIARVPDEDGGPEEAIAPEPTGPTARGRRRKRPVADVTSPLETALSLSWPETMACLDVAGSEIELLAALVDQAEGGGAVVLRPDADRPALEVRLIETKTSGQSALVAAVLAELAQIKDARDRLLTVTSSGPVSILELDIAHGGGAEPGVDIALAEQALPTYLAAYCIDLLEKEVTSAVLYIGLHIAEVGLWMESKTIKMASREAGHLLLVAHQETALTLAEAQLDYASFHGAGPPDGAVKAPGASDSPVVTLIATLRPLLH